MAAGMVNKEERIGLIVALAAHAMLLVLILWHPSFGDSFVPPQRIEVTLTDEVGLKSTSPDPFEDASPDIAPVIGERAQPQPVQELDRIIENARPEVTSPPRPAPRDVSRPAPRTESKPTPPAPRAAAAPRSSERSGGSRIGSDFLEGVPGSQSSGRSSSPRAESLGPEVRSSLSGAITRQLKPHWAAPQGPDAEELITILAWNLNEDGSLSGTPRVVRQLGVNDVNRAQASRHAEQAVRAVQLAAPFDLPGEYYDAWKRVSSFRFDKRLSQ